MQSAPGAVADRGKQVNKQTKTIGSALPEYLESCEANGLGYSTIRDYKFTLNELAEALGSALPLSKCGRPELERWKNGLRCSGSTRSKKVKHAKAFFAWVEMMGYGSDASRSMKVPKFKEEAVMPHTDAEIDTILRNASGETRAAILLLLYSGLRISDALKLKRSNLKDGVIVLRTEKCGTPVLLRLHPDCLEALESLPADRAYLLRGNESHGAAYQRIWGAMRKLGSELGIEIRPHGFRHTFACKLLRSGVDVKTVSRLLGHKSIATTEKHYLAFIPAYQQQMHEAVSRLDFSPKVVSIQAA